ncbi:uncharacterized protein LOC117147943 [Drosophila mauritiana]|uniref:Uncharacterized protein LOC117147943 n=1 Tax=Drosophila mauritiana TaxID=7226 RepID=A0A6P8L571_DROMA|nr:uncharacterized protein LOC117147943 [Drosophila mauritiana]
MEDLHLKLGDLSQEVLAARHSMIMGQKLAGSLGETQHHLQHEHHLNHQLNQLNQLSHLNQYHHLSQLNQLSKLHQHLQHKISSEMNLNLDLDHEIETEMEMEMGLDGLDVDLDLNLNMKLGVNLDMNPEGSITNSTSSTSSTSSASRTSRTNSTSSTNTCSDQGQGHGFGIGLGDPKRDQSQVHYAHDPAQDNGDSPNVTSCTGMCSHQTESNMIGGDSLTVTKSSSPETGKGEKDQEELKEEEEEDVKEVTEDKKHNEDVLIKAANSKLNGNATVYTMPGKVEPLPDGRHLPQPSPSATSQATGDYRLNAQAAVFEPSFLCISSLASPVVFQQPRPIVVGSPPPEVSQHQMSAISQPLLPTPHLMSHEMSAHGFHSIQRSGNKPSGRWRKQPLPDLFSAVMSLVTELKRSVSYPEIIGCLSKRLHREQVELKRHVPHTLHAAVNNGYLKKEGNRYSLLPEVEQAEIMRRNIAAAIRAKELEKEPLSWRRR